MKNLIFIFNQMDPHQIDHTVFKTTAIANIVLSHSTCPMQAMFRKLDIKANDRYQV